MHIRTFFVFCICCICGCSYRDIDRPPTDAYINKLTYEGKDYWSLDLYTDYGQQALIAPCNNGNVGRISISFASQGSLGERNQERPKDGRYTDNFIIDDNNKARRFIRGYIVIYNNGKSVDLELQATDVGGSPVDIPSGKYVFRNIR